MKQEILDAVLVGTKLVAEFNLLRDQIRKVGFDFEIKLDTEDEYIFVLVKKNELL